MEDCAVKKLDFAIPFSGFSDLDFINVLASVLLHLEGKKDKKDGYRCAKRSGGRCCGCGECRSLQEMVYFLLDTMSGRSSLRCRFDETPTDMQQWIGENREDSCGTAETVDFLFGYIGYRYRKVTDPAVFAEEVKASVDGGRPIIAETTDGEHGRYRVIIGYDGGQLLEPAYQKAQDLPDKAVTYDDLNALYIIGDKVPRRYTEKDGLERIVRVMEYNEQAGLWDEYEQKIGWYGGMDAVSVDERAARMKRTADTMWHTFNCHNFAEVFRYRITDGLKMPVFDELQKNINGNYGYTHDLAWSLIGLNDLIRWDAQHQGIIIGYAESIQLILHKIHEHDRTILRLVKATLENMQ